MSHLRLYNVGDYVSVAPSRKSSGGTGWITSIAEGNSNVNVDYIEVVGRKQSKEVDPIRLSLVPSLQPAARKRSTDGVDSVPLPSILSPEYAEVKKARVAMIDATNSPKSNVRQSNMSLEELEFFQTQFDDDRDSNEWSTFSMAITEQQQVAN